jgi:hypothetical protein
MITWSPGCQSRPKATNDKACEVLPSKAMSPVLGALSRRARRRAGAFGGQPGRVVAGASLQVVTGEACHGLSGPTRPRSDRRVVQVTQARSLLELIKKHRHAWKIRAIYAS